MSVIQLPTSIYDRDVVSLVLGDDLEIATIEEGHHLRMRIPELKNLDEAIRPPLGELLNQALRASIEAKLPALRPEDE